MPISSMSRPIWRRRRRRTATTKAWVPTQSGTPGVSSAFLSRLVASGHSLVEAFMSNPHSTAQIAGHPIHPMLVPFPIAFFTATLVCDLAYRRTLDIFWFTSTQYLLGAGILMALLAALAGFTDFLSDQRIRALSIAWWHMLGNLLMVVVQVVNWYLRHDMGADAV